MTQEQLKNILSAIGYPVAYSHFKQKVSAPFITYLFTSSADLIADNMNYYEISNYQIELYTDKKDLEVESEVQKALKDNEIPYQKSETWIEDEKLFQILYEIEIIGE